MSGEQRPAVEPGPAHVATRIAAGDSWYVDSQRAWADLPGVRRVMDRRFAWLAARLALARAETGAGARVLRVLDLGCGDGYWLARLSTLPGVELTGVDYNPLRVARARLAAPAAHLHCADLAGFVAARPFDVVLLNQVIEHLDDDLGMLVHVRGLLARRGRMLLGAPNEGSTLQRWYLDRRGRRAASDHRRFYREAGLRATLAQAGWTVDAAMREIHFLPSDRLYYGLAARAWGFRLLSVLTALHPAGCSDYYFDCRPAVTA